MPSSSRTDYIASAYSNIAGTTPTPAEPALPPPSVVVLQLSSSRSDSGPVPSWRRKIREGLAATSSLTGERRTLELQDGEVSICAAPNFTSPYPYFVQTRARGDLCQMFSPNGLLLDNTPARNKAKMSFVKDCLRALETVNSQVFFGELGSTLRMIKNPLKALRSGIDDYHQTLRKRRRGSKSNRRRIIAETWLEYQYGWRPLVSDIEGGLEALRRFSRTPIRLQPVRGSGSAEVDFSPPPVKVNFSYGKYIIIRKHTCVASVRYQGLINLTTGGREVLTSNLGLRLDNFVPTLWELLPYSFLVDYFSNVGDIISSWALGTSNLRWAFESSRTETLFEHSVSSWIRDSGTDHVDILRQRVVPCKSRGKHVVVNRTPGIGSLIPDFRLEIPGLTSTKWLNLAALSQSRSSLRPY